MAIDAINGNSGVYTGYYNSAVSAKESKADGKFDAKEKNDVAAVYEKSDSKVEAADQKKLWGRCL